MLLVFAIFRQFLTFMGKTAEISKKLPVYCSNYIDHIWDRKPYLKLSIGYFLGKKLNDIKFKK